MAECARLEIWCLGNWTVGSNPTLSATLSPSAKKSSTFHYLLSSFSSDSFLYVILRPSLAASGFIRDSVG